MRTLIAVLIAGFAVCDARAQTVMINRPQPVGSGPAQRQRVNVNITVATPLAPATQSVDITGSLSTANTSLYAIVNHQCDVLGPLLNGDCRLVGITTNGTISDRPALGVPPSVMPTVNVTANATFEIDPKAPEPVPAH